MLTFKKVNRLRTASLVVEDFGEIWWSKKEPEAKFAMTLSGKREMFRGENALEEAKKWMEQQFEEER